MLNFDFKKSSRKCCQSEREFQPGDEFYSALIEGEDGSTERRDYGTDQWDGLPDDCIGWWKSSVPEIGKGRVYWAPKNVLLAFFEHVHRSPQTADVAYITGILLVQKKVLTMEDDGGGDASKMFLRNRSSKEAYELSVAEVTPARLAEIQDELAERLFTDQPVAADSDVKGVEEP